MVIVDSTITNQLRQSTGANDNRERERVRGRKTYDDGKGEARTARSRAREGDDEKREFDKPSQTCVTDGTWLAHCIAFVDRFGRVPSAGASGMGINMTQGGSVGRGQQGRESKLSQ